MNVSQGHDYMRPMSDQAESLKIFPWDYWTTYISGPLSSVTG